MKVTGAWHGEYGYEPSSRMPARQPVPFELVLKQWWFGYFKGTVTDDVELGMPGTGFVRGRFSYPRIRFAKQMPVSWVSFADGRRGPLSQFLIEQGYPCHREIPHRPIFYQGEFLDPNHAQGTWIIKGRQGLQLGNGKVFKFAETKGTWQMQKAGTAGK